MTKENTSKEKKKNIHEGHRARLRFSVDKDPELEAFSDFETLEYLLSFLVPRKDTNPIAHALIEAFDSLYGVMTATSEELFKITGMTKSAAHLLPNLLAVLRKAEMSRQKRSVIVETVRGAVEILRPYFLGRNNEIFYLMTLDVNDRIMQISCISQGIGNLTNVDINLITSKISRTHACKAILAHNHPGGNLVPSDDDVRTTSSILYVLNTMGKELVDHLIFSGDNYFSFYENDLLNKVLESTDKLLGNDRNKEVSSRLFVNKYVLEKTSGEKSYRKGGKDGRINCGEGCENQGQDCSQNGDPKGVEKRKSR